MLFEHETDAWHVLLKQELQELLSDSVTASLEERPLRVRETIRRARKWRGERIPFRVCPPE